MPPIVSRGFHRRRAAAQNADRVPPGQYVTDDYPVLSAGPTPRTPLADWTFTIEGLVEAPVTWTWAQLNALPQESFTVDIHCVTKWTHLDMRWRGVSLDRLLEAVVPQSEFVSVFADGGYTTNLPLADLRGGRAWVAHTYDGEPLEPSHGGPARMVVPHLYFWKSAKWVRGMRFTARDEPGFWERAGYSNYGDPWREQRYQGD
jgi:DMSO/TMAO reductase YedYZ molybdopterin-dependent catalytic subunit